MQNLLVITLSIFILSTLTNLNNTFAEEINNTNSEKNTSHLKDSHQLTTFGSLPSWSHDGKQLVFVKNAPYGPFTPPDEIWIIDMDGSDPHPIKKIPKHTTASYPKFSPDGKKIAFISDYSDYSCSDCHSRNYLSVMNSDSSYTREVADGGYSLEFTWTVDNKIILARANNQTSTSLFRIDPRLNSEPVFLTQLPLYIDGWNIVINNDGTKLLFTGLDYHYNSQLYSLDLANYTMKTIQETDGLFLVSLSKDEQTIFATDDSRSNSFTLYAIDAKNMTKTQLSYGYVGYAIHENTDTSSDIRIASGYYPGGVVSSDKEQMDKIGIYVNTFVIPEFPFAMPVIVIAIASLVVFHRITTIKI
jgi:Tol biopolymer transport system component